METFRSILFGFAGKYLLLVSLLLEDVDVNNKFLETLVLAFAAGLSIFELYCVWFYFSERVLPSLNLF